MLSLLKELKPTPARKMIKSLTLYYLFPLPRHSRSARSRLTTAATFSRQNDVSSRLHYLVLRKSRTRSRTRFTILTSL